MTATNLTRVEGGHKVTCRYCAHRAIYRDVRAAVRDYRDHKCPQPREGTTT